MCKFYFTLDIPEVFHTFSKAFILLFQELQETAGENLFQYSYIPQHT